MREAAERGSEAASLFDRISFSRLGDFYRNVFVSGIVRYYIQGATQLVYIKKNCALVFNEYTIFFFFLNPEIYYYSPFGGWV